MRALRGAWLAGIFALMGTGFASGQAVYGSIYGTVTDPTGAAVPNAQVTVTDVAKGTSVNLQTNGAGEFTADHLIPDEYSVKVTAQGFKAFEQTSIRVFADTSAKVTPSLVIGGSSETVEVSAESQPQLKADRADVSTTLSSQEIVDLPIPDRNFTNLQLLLPGAQQLGWSHAASENPQGSKQIEVDGQAFAGVAFQLDGTDNQDPILGIIVVNPNSDSLSETKITTQNFDAEFGKAVSSVVTAQTKSGSNKLHGSLFDYRESNANLARDPFTQSNKGPTPQINAINPFPAGLKNQFGGSIGGPIIKDKLFFFGDYQGVRQKVGISVLQTVPTAHLISTCLGTATSTSGAAGCDFNEYANGAIGNFATSSTQLIYQPNSTTPYANNVIPTGALSPQALALLKLLQPYAPNTAGSNGGLSNNFAKSGTGGFNSDQWDVRGDWQTSQKIHTFGRFSRFTDTLTGNTVFGPAGGAGFGLGKYGGTSKGANDSAAAGIDILISQTLVTDVRLGYFRYGINTSKYDQNVAFATQLGIPNLNTGSNFTNGAPGFMITDVGNFGQNDPGQSAGSQYGAGLNINRCNCPLAQHEDQYQIANNWTKTLGSHSIKLGVDLRYARNLRVPSDTNRTGLLHFGTGPTSGGNATSGLGFATFVLGDVTSFGRYVSTSTNAKEFQKRDFFYVQDTWRATQKLTLNLGLRYEMYFPETVNGKGNGSLLNLNTGYLQVAGYGNIGSNMNQIRPNNTYNPRIGAAFQATPTTVVRAGYGRSFDIGVFGSIFGHAATQNLPILASQSISTPGGTSSTNTAFAFNMATGPSSYTPTAVPSTGLLPNPGNLVTSRARPVTLRLPTLDAWNASLQQAFTSTMSLTVAYVGNKGTHTFGDSSGNTTNPNEAAIFLPAQYSITGSALHYDPTVATGISATGGTRNSNYLSRYYGGKLPACSDPNYVLAGGVNAPNGGCGWTNGITYYSDDLDTHYNALQVTLAKTMAHGYSFTANYAWQHATSESTGFSTWNRQAVKGNDSALRRQQIIVYGLFQLPFGRNKMLLGHANPIVNQIVGGWEINPVVNYSSGLPYTVRSNKHANWVPDSAPQYPNGDPHAWKTSVSGFPGNKLRWFNTTSLGQNGLTAPALDTIGNFGRNSVFGPHFFNTDLSVQKNFQIHESITFQLRADAFNAFNHINWGLPDGTLETGGSISSGPFPDGGTNPRQMQFSARFQF